MDDKSLATIKYGVEMFNEIFGEEIQFVSYSDDEVLLYNKKKGESILLTLKDEDKKDG